MPQEAYDRGASTKALAKEEPRVIGAVLKQINQGREKERGSAPPMPHPVFHNLFFPWFFCILFDTENCDPPNTKDYSRKRSIRETKFTCPTTLELFFFRCDYDCV